MDRAVVYDAQQPRTTDFLNAAKFALFDSAYQNRGWLGDSTAALNRGWQGSPAVVAGLACAATTPASLQVTVGVGSIYALATVDANPYGDLLTDSHVIVKQGMLADPVTLTITPPTQPGFSQVYLIEAQMIEGDGSLGVLQYYNATNPFAPLQGPGGSNVQQPTVRQVRCNILLKAGVATATGSEVAPAVDSGCVALYTIDVPNGDTAITGNQIVQLDNAPFFPTLPGVPPGLQNNQWTYAQDVGSTNALAAKILPPVTALAAGIGVFIKVANTSTGACTFNLNGTGAVAVHRGNGGAITAGDLNAGQVAALYYDGTAWQVLNFFGYTASTTNNNTVNITIPYAQDVGPANALKGLYSPLISALTPGLLITLRVANTNTGPTTMQCDNTAVVPVTQNGAPLFARAVVQNEIVLLLYDGTSFQLVNTRWPYYSFNENAPPASDIPMAVGDQVNITFSNIIAVPLHIATVPGVYDIEIMLTANNMINSDFEFRPNNTTYFGKFCNYTMQEDYYLAPLPVGVDSRPMVWGVLSNSTDNLGSGPSTVLSTNCFGFDLWFQSGPWQSEPIVNDIGACTLRLTCSTLTAGKQVHSWTGIRGGAGIGYSLWEDTTTPWTSLGTFGGAASGGPFVATLSGSIIVRRLA